MFPLLVGLATSACVEQADEGDLAETEQGLRDSTYDCHYEIHNVDNDGEPTNQDWYYCVCGVQGNADPNGWDVGGGYSTMPQSYCNGWWQEIPPAGTFGPFPGEQ